MSAKDIFASGWRGGLGSLGMGLGSSHHVACFLILPEPLNQGQIKGAIMSSLGNRCSRSLGGSAGVRASFNRLRHAFAATLTNLRKPQID